MVSATALVTDESYDRQFKWCQDNNYKLLPDSKYRKWRHAVTSGSKTLIEDFLSKADTEDEKERLINGVFELPVNIQKWSKMTVTKRYHIITPIANAIASFSFESVKMSFDPLY